MLTAILILLLLAAGYLGMILPRLNTPDSISELRVDYAHRGLWNGQEIPENSAAAFRLATEKGFGIELDLQLSKDGEIMVFHDYSLKRMCGVDRKLSELTFKELRSLRLGGTDEQIPTFKEVLAIVDGKVPLLIELKGENSDDALCWKVAPMLDAYLGAYSVESFNPLLLSWFRTHRPSAVRGQLVTNLLREKEEGSKLRNGMLSFLLTNFLSRPDFIACDRQYTGGPALWILFKLLKKDVFLWTVDDRKDFLHFKKEGCHSIFERFIP